MVAHRVGAVCASRGYVMLVTGRSAAHQEDGAIPIASGVREHLPVHVLVVTLCSTGAADLHAFCS